MHSSDLSPPPNLPPCHFLLLQLTRKEGKDAGFLKVTIEFEPKQKDSATEKPAAAAAAVATPAPTPVPATAPVAYPPQYAAPPPGMKMQSMC